MVGAGLVLALTVLFGLFWGDEAVSRRESNRVTDDSLPLSKNGGAPREVVSVPAVATADDPGRPIRVRCLDPGGLALRGVGVVAFGPRGRRMRAATDRSGTAGFLVPSNERWQIVASAPGLGWAFTAVHEGGPKIHSLVLGGIASVEGVAVTASGTALAGLGLMLSPLLTEPPTGSASLELTRAARTGPAGRFRLDRLARGVEYEIAPRVNGAATRTVRPPATVRIVLDPKWSIELLRASSAEFDLTWEIVSTETSTAEFIMGVVVNRSSGTWPRGQHRLLVPAWPGASRIIVRVRFGNDSYATEVDLPQEGGHAIAAIPLTPGSPRIRVKNPHEHPAALFRYGNGDDRSARLVVGAGEEWVLPVPVGRSRFRSAVYPHGVARWTVEVSAGETRDIVIPVGPNAPGVVFGATNGDGRAIARAQLMLNPAPGPSVWHVAYVGRAPKLFTGVLALSGGEALVVAGSGAFRYEVLAPGYQAKAGDWPRAGSLRVSLRSKPGAPNAAGPRPGGRRGPRRR